MLKRTIDKLYLWSDLGTSTIVLVIARALVEPADKRVPTGTSEATPRALVANV